MSWTDDIIYRRSMFNTYRLQKILRYAQYDKGKVHKNNPGS